MAAAITHKDWHVYFGYDDGKLIRLFSNSNRNKVGDEAGSLLSNGYLHIRIDGRSYRNHRIVWEMHNGDIPAGFEIDHVNGIRHDNRIENLRLVSRSDNMKNRKMSSNNSSGFCGIFWSRTGKHWVASIYDNGIRYQKKSVNKGVVIAWRKSKEKELSYSSRHGKEI